MTTLSACRSCTSSRLTAILSLGNLPLANALLTEQKLSDVEPTYPLDLVFCRECTLVQITETVSREALFRDYLYFSSVSDTVLKNARDLVERIIPSRHLTEQSLVLEIASNDGYLLKNYRERSVPVLGVEPAENIAKIALERGVPTLAEFFTDEVAKRIVNEHGQADIVHANNVVAHVADLHGVVAGIATLLKPDGVTIIENHYVKDLIDHVEFDSIYHEHLFYYSATSFKNLFAGYGLRLVDVERIPMHGGSLRVYFAHDSHTPEPVGISRVEHLLKEEQAWGVGDIAFYRDFGSKVERLKQELLTMLKDLPSHCQTNPL